MGHDYDPGGHRRRRDLAPDSGERLMTSDDWPVILILALVAALALVWAVSTI